MEVFMNNGKINKEDTDWKKAVIRAGATIEDVIRNIDQSSLKISMVVGPEGMLLGTVTDGDIRRALLRGLSLQSLADEVMSRTPLVVPEEMSRESALHLMRANGISQLPIVDGGRVVVGLHVWDRLMTSVERNNLMVIMAGGFGKRLRPYTDVCPKPMLPVGGKPMLEHIVERAIDNGFSNFVISLHYLPHVIKSHFGDGSRWGVKISYVFEENPLGTAGAIGLLNPAPDAPFVVTNGDVLTDINYAELLDFHQKHQASATMAVRQHEWQHPFGVVKTEGIQIVGVEEKPIHRTYVNAGIYALNPSVLTHLVPGVPCDMPNLFERLHHAAGQTIAYPMHEPWIDVGRPEDLQNVNQQIFA